MGLELAAGAAAGALVVLVLLLPTLLRRAEKRGIQRERARLARDLHDGVAPELTRLLLRSRRQGLPDLEAGCQVALRELRRCVVDLRSPPCTLPELQERLQRRCSELVPEGRVRVRWSVSQEERHRARSPLPGATVETVERAVLEGVLNASKHGAARHVDVDLELEHGLKISVRDDGTGFDSAPCRLPGGLSNLRARAEEARGSLRVTNRAGGGAQLSMSLPA